jgi:hypothetical protein
MRTQSLRSTSALARDSGVADAAVAKRVVIPPSPAMLCFELSAARRPNDNTAPGAHINDQTRIFTPQSADRDSCRIPRQSRGRRGSGHGRSTTRVRRFLAACESGAVADRQSKLVVGIVQSGDDQTAAVLRRAGPGANAVSSALALTCSGNASRPALGSARKCAAQRYGGVPTYRSGLSKRRDLPQRRHDCASRRVCG